MKRYVRRIHICYIEKKVDAFSRFARFPTLGGIADIRFRFFYPYLKVRQNVFPVISGERLRISCINVARNRFRSTVVLLPQT